MNVRIVIRSTCTLMHIVRIQHFAAYVRQLNEYPHKYCVLSIAFGDDHFSSSCVVSTQMAEQNRTICTQKVLLQFWQGMLPASFAVVITLTFLASLFCSVEELRLLSYALEPLKMSECHCSLSRASCSQEPQLILNAFKEALSLALFRLYALIFALLLLATLRGRHLGRAEALRKRAVWVRGYSGERPFGSEAVWVRGHLG